MLTRAGPSARRREIELASAPSNLEMRARLKEVGLEAIHVGSGNWMVSVSSQPRSWMVVGGVGTLVAGIGTPLLCLRRTRFATVVITTDYTGTSLRVEGHPSVTAKISEVFTPSPTRPAFDYATSTGVEHLPASADLRPADAEHAFGEPTPSGEVQPQQRLEPPPSLPPAPASVWTAPVGSNDDETTVAGNSVAEFRKEVIPDVLVITFDTGEEIAVEQTVRVGRSPEASATVTVVAINDPESSVSRLHFVVTPAGGRTWIEDSGSTNGTGILRRGELIELVKATPVVLEPGDLVAFGRRRAEVTLRR